MFRFEGLEIWRAATQYVKNVYTLTNALPRSEMYGLTSQIRRSAVSVTANIAEGSASRSDKEFRSFLSYSIRSVSENVSEIIIAHELGFIQKNKARELYNEAEILIKRLTALRKSI